MALLIDFAHHSSYPSESDPGLWCFGMAWNHRTLAHHIVGWGSKPSRVVWISLHWIVVGDRNLCCRYSLYVRIREQNKSTPHFLDFGCLNLVSSVVFIVHRLDFRIINLWPTYLTALGGHHGKSHPASCKQTLHRNIVFCLARFIDV